MSNNVTAAMELVMDMSPAERAQVLDELADICSEESPFPPRLIKDGKGRLRAVLVEFFPKPTESPPPLTDEEIAEIKQRVADKSDGLSYRQFTDRVRALVRQSRGTK